jgi:IS605 OrfB family transposase
MDNIITRKIQILVNYDDKEKRIDYYKKLREWNQIVDKGSNLISTHRYVQSQLVSLIYLSENIKMKIADSAKDETGILNTSSMNSLYKVLSSMFKGDIPTDILSCLNQKISRTFTENKKDIVTGKKSLMSFRRNQPVPFSAVAMRQIEPLVKDEKATGDYTFNLFGIPMKTYFGRDMSQNKVIFERMLAGEYKMNSSSYQFDGEKLFLRLTVSFPKNQTELIDGRVCEATLDFDTPIIAKLPDSKRESALYQIGNKEEFLHQRLAIQNGLHRLQKNLKYVKGGKGRRKLQKLDAFEKAEKNYIRTKLHTYSHLLVKYALQNKCAIIILKNYEAVKDAANANKELLLRNWNYYGLSEFVKYKASMYGIVVEVPELPKEPEATLNTTADKPATANG